MPYTDVLPDEEGHCPIPEVYEADDEQPEPSPILDKHGNPIQYYVTQRNRIGFKMPWWEE